jgi:hypothetical protein
VALKNTADHTVFKTKLEAERSVSFISGYDRARRVEIVEAVGLSDGSIRPQNDESS